jgi:hypothetical protein
MNIFEKSVDIQVLNLPYPLKEIIVQNFSQYVKIKIKRE